MKKIIVFLLLSSGLLISNLVSADVVNPDYLITQCPLNKLQRECFYSSKEAFESETKSDCEVYENNSSCEFLAGTGSSFGGQRRYCCEPGFKNASSSGISQIEHFGSVLLLTLLLELPVFLIFGFREKKALLAIALANLISVSAFYAANFWLSGIGFILISELAIIIFEIIFLATILKGNKIKKIILATLTANLVSAIIGGILISFLALLGAFKIVS